MDYCLFDLIDEHHPSFAKWVEFGDHFAFMNQAGAGFANLTTSVSALEPLLDKAGKQTLKQKLKDSKNFV